MDSKDLKHVTSILVMRHGARAPSKAALGAFSANAEVKKSWTLEDGSVFLEDITDAGKRQCQNVGAWARSYLKNNSKLENLDTENIKWRSSRVDRVLDSGKFFWDGFCSEQEKNISIDFIPYEKCDDDIEGVPTADLYFRSWDVHASYKKWANDLLKSAEFGLKSKEANDKLNSVVSTLGLKQFEAYPKPAVLYGMTFAREMVDCERYYEKVSEKPLEKLLSKSDFEAIDELSLWCWDNRFFKHDFIELLSSKILDDIYSDIKNPGKTNFSLYTGHDYTLLVILAGLGIEKYEELLSFAAYLVFDVYDRKNEETGETERIFTLSLNATPFEVDNKATKELQEQNTKKIKNPKTDSIYWKI